MPIFECSRCNELTYSSSVDAAGACARCGSERHRVLEGGFADARLSPRALAEGDHGALVYEDADRVAPFCARFLSEGIDAGECVLAGVQDDLRRAIAPLLAPRVEELVEWRSPGDIYGDFDADRIASMYDELIGGESRTTRILAGLDRPSAEDVTPDEFDRYEASAHAIVTGHGATVVCLYDARALSPELLEVAARRHTLWVEDDVVSRNERFEYLPA